jgi:ribosomal protein S4
MSTTREFMISKKINKILQFFYFKFLKKIEIREQQNKRYIYRIDLRELIPAHKRLNPNFISIRIIRYFYLTLNYRHFRKMAIKAKKQDGYFGYNYMLLLEGRIVCMIYRSSFIANMFEAIKIVNLGLVWVNKRYVNFINNVVGIMQIIGFRYLLMPTIY